MFIYKIFDTYFKSNIALPLNPVTNVFEHNDEVNIIFRKYYVNDNNNIIINYDNNKADVLLANFAIYNINFKDKEIQVLANSKNDFISTFFNIPLSVFFINQGKVLLHSSSVVYNNRLFAFVGEKGIGKSTLTSILIKKSASFFSDDILLVSYLNESLIAYKAPNIIKLTEETYNIIMNDNKFELFNKNIINKAYINPNIIGKHQSCPEVIHLSSIYKIERHKEKIIHKKKYVSAITKKALFLGQIVGVKYFNNELLKLAMYYIDKINFSNLDMYILNIPNNLKEILDHEIDEYL